jgi:alkanesulfonate monooxygenase SsuD/methylene tetrahydromethanopterin reductase-like flavin-dependent oxidoreductase (luciferase family)
VAEASAVLDQRCAEIGRDPAQIRRSVQLRVAEANDELLELAQSYRAVGVTEVVLILYGQNPVGLAEQVAGLLPRLREAG